MNPQLLAEILQSFQLGLAAFAAVFAQFHHATAPVPTSAAPQIITTLQATPGLTDGHKAVIAAAVNAAAATA